MVDRSKQSLLKKAVLRFRTGPQRRLRAALAHRRRLRSSATFIAVTGSSGKSTTVGLLAHILEAHAPTKRQVLENTINELIRSLKRLRGGERFVVAELGVGHVGDMKPMATMLQPDVAIVTMVGVEHYSSFRGREGVAREKGELVEALRPTGVAILNADDEFVMEMRARTQARIVTFAKNTPEATYRASAIHVAYPALLSFTLTGGGHSLHLKTPFPGEHFWLPVSAALEFGVPPDVICRQVETFDPVAERCSILRAPDGPVFILDSAKAPNSTLALAFDMLAKAKAPRKRLVLGVISDYAGAQTPIYKKAWRAAREVADEVIFVGKDISHARPSAEDVASGRIIGFETPVAAFEHIRRTAVPDELILIKASKNLHLARLAIAFVRPVRCWEPACGTGADCFTCHGLAVEFDRKSFRRRSLIARLKRRISARLGDTKS